MIIEPVDIIASVIQHPECVLNDCQFINYNSLSDDEELRIRKERFTVIASNYSSVRRNNNHTTYLEMVKDNLINNTVIKINRFMANMPKDCAVDITNMKYYMQSSHNNSILNHVITFDLLILQPEEVNMSQDNWKHRNKNMKCVTCMWFVIKEGAAAIGRCRRRAPTMNGFPVVYVSDWCGDHKLDETKIPQE